METTAEWRAELRSVVRPMLDALLANDGLTLTTAEFDFMVRFEPQPNDGNPLTWYGEIKERAFEMARNRTEHTDAVNTGAMVDEPIPTEDPRWGALGEVLAIEARENPYVGNWRYYHLPPEGLLSREDALAFREQLDEKASRWLDQIGASLVEWHGWWDADEAALFVLTGLPPSGRRIRTKIVVRDRVGASRVIIEADPRASPQAIADSYRNARSTETLASLNLPPTVERHHRLNGARPHPVSEKYAALAVHLARNRDGSWANRRDLWNDTIRDAHPEWTYGADAGFARDAGRAWNQVVGETFTHKRSQLRSLV